ncbi:hypothetical protein QTP86_015221, partial [Hemibagrus guttatus]
MDFRKQRTPPNPINIMGAEVDIVDNYKYLGVHIDNKLDWIKTSDSLYKKDVLRLGVASIIFCAVVCWGSRVKTADANRLNKLIREAGSVIGVELMSLDEVSERRMLRKHL